jgi:putative DNA primase/helicase
MLGGSKHELHDVNVETAVLGELMLEPGQIQNYAHLLSARSFTTHQNRLVLSAIFAIWHETRSVDAVTVAEWLSRNGTLSVVGGPDGVKEYLEAVPYGYHLHKHVETLLDLENRRLAMGRIDEIRARVMNRNTPLSAILPPDWMTGTTSSTMKHDWPKPKALPQELGPVATFDSGILPAILKPWAEDIAERMQVPIDFPAIGLMISLAGVVGRKLCIRPKRYDVWEVVPNLWGAIVGRPGVLKSPALDEAMRPLRRVEREAHDSYVQARASYDAQTLGPKASRGSDDDSADDEGGKITEPVERRYIVADVTSEKLGELLQENPTGLTLIRDELTGFLRFLDKPGQETARAFYLECWNGCGDFVFDRILRGTTRIESACLSVIGGIQPGPLKAYRDAAQKNGAGDDGLIQRFQLLVWPDQDDVFVNVDRWPDKKAKNGVFDLFDKIDKRDGFQCGGKVDQDDRHGIPYVRFTNPAQRLFDEWREGLESRLRSGELEPAMESHLSKYRSLVPTLALLTNLADDEVGAVPDSALSRAIKWAEYLETHAARVYGLSRTQAPVQASALAAKILAGDLRNSFTSREVYQRDWKNLAEADDVKRAATFLETLGWLRKTDVETGGRPSTRWEISPRLPELEAEPAKPTKAKVATPEAEPFEGSGGSPSEGVSWELASDAGEPADDDLPF